MKVFTSFFLIGCIALLCALFPYPLLDGRKLFWGIFLPGFAVIAMFLRGGSARTGSVKYFLAALLPWLLACLFFANGAFDRSEERRYSTVVVETHYSYRS